MCFEIARRDDERSKSNNCKKEQQQFTCVAKERKEDQKPFKIPGILKPS